MGIIVSYSHQQPDAGLDQAHWSVSKRRTAASTEVQKKGFETLLEENPITPPQPSPVTNSRTMTPREGHRLARQRHPVLNTLLRQYPRRFQPSGLQHRCLGFEYPCTCAEHDGELWTGL
jgi:hypothetical protein